ncbi:MAG: hypothetical protein LBC19_15585, partial [Tannerella sp.]|nr:hypothetical protein [Tannerella sp.]
MNKKIFTLLVGALLSMTSLFTVKAQTLFADTLRADAVENLSSMDKAYYLLSVTGIANSTLTGLNPPNISASSRDSSYVLYVDNYGQLRLDIIKDLDHKYVDLGYGGSKKIGAIRHASWCVSYNDTKVDGANIEFDFTNLHGGRSLQAPFFDAASWRYDLEDDGQSRYIYESLGSNQAINLVNDEDVIVSGWHFSQTHNGTQPLQTNMPLYSYVELDSVLVFVLDEGVTYDNPTLIGNEGTGGWKVTVKYVAINDLVGDAAGNVRIGGSKYVENVLLFTLKKLDKFVLNADDYNAVRTTIKFEPDALNVKAENDGWNPFTTPKEAGVNPHAQGPLTAFETKDDSLYKYGYLQFENEDHEWLYVDTAYWNYGNDQFLKFNWSEKRRDTSDIYNEGKWSDDTPFERARDSIMENQSKFRVVYDPYTDSTFINVYQTRVRYTDYKDPQHPVSYPWWKNSFILNPDGSVTNPPIKNSWSGKIAESSPKKMDTVMISTADTAVL